MQVVAELGDQLIVKPAREGSTIGITKVTRHDNNELALAYEAAVQYDDTVLIRQLIAGRELTCAILGDGPSAKRCAADQRSALPVPITTTTTSTSATTRSTCARRPWTQRRRAVSASSACARIERSAHAGGAALT
jgi:hypothetical protein